MSKTIFEGGNNPIFSFISSQEKNNTEADHSNSQSEIKPQSEISSNMKPRRSSSTSIKTRRLNLLIQPELHEKMVKIARIKQMSVNAVLIVAVKEYCVKEVRALEKYERTFGADAEEV